MNILVGVTGSISAYKILDVISTLKKNNHDVQVIMTESAEMFVTEMSLAVLSQRPVINDWVGDLIGCVEHVEYAKWADVMLIAPATANTLSKMTSGMLDNPLLCAYSVFVGKHGYESLIIAPAMNTHMYNMTTSLGHLEFFEFEGAKIIHPQEGRLACGEIGRGKLANVNDIANITMAVCSNIKH